METTEIIERWLYGRSKNTQDAYLRDIEQAMRFWDGPPLEAIALGHLQDYQTHLIQQRRLKDASVKRKMNALGSLLDFAYQQEWIPKNPALKLKTPKVHDAIHDRILSVEQVKAIIEAAKPGRDRALLLFTYATGGRISEVCGLLWKDCTPKPDGSAVVRLLGKGDKWRAVKVPASVWSIVAELRSPSLSDEAKVFGLQRRQAHDIVKAAVQKSGAPDEASAHWLRHSNASHSLEAGAPIHVVRDSLGHASIQTTDKYLHSNPDQSASDYLNL
jgi:integrase/recombinase XerD